MARPRSVYACTQCGAQQPRWLGRCPECGSWSTLVEEARGRAEGARGEPLGGLPSSGESDKPRALRDVDADAAPRISTGLSELDRVLGGGLVPGSVTLLAGEPGVGKSTLALQLASAARTQKPILYVTNAPAKWTLRHARTSKRPERVVGYFANPIVLRCDLSADPPFEQLLREVHTNLVRGLDHQDFPFALLVEELRPQRDAGHNPLFQAMMDWQRTKRADEYEPVARDDQASVRFDLG